MNCVVHHEVKYFLYVHILPSPIARDVCGTHSINKLAKIVMLRPMPTRHLFMQFQACS
jgi:hypothetical protein